MLVANLLKQDGRNPSIRFEEIQSCSPTPDYQVVPTVASYTLRSSSNAGANKDNFSPKKISNKALSKGGKAVATLVHLLSPYPPTRGQSKKTIATCHTKSVPSVVVGDCIIVMEETFSAAHKMDAHSWNLFFGTEFYFPNVLANAQRGLKSIQYLQTSSPTIKFDDQILKEADTTAFDSIDIISGICIFNGDILKTSTGSSEAGKVDIEKLRQAQPTFHEMEYISRSSIAIADIVGMLISRFCCQRVEVPVTIGLDIPSFHYYHVAITAFNNGIYTHEEALQWCEAVDIRHDQIAHVFSTAVRHQLQLRGVDPADYKIRISPKVAPMVSSIKADLKDCRKPVLESTLQELDMEEEMSCWKKFYQLVTAKERPKDFGDLSYLFYVFFILKLALTGNLDASVVGEEVPACKTRFDSPTEAPKTESKPRRLIVSIDDPAERRIYSRSQEMMRKLRQSPENPTDSALVEVYMCRRVLVNGNRTRARLYHHDPIPEVPNLSSLSDGGNCEAQLIEPLAVVGELYGFDCAKNLQSWLAEAGLQKST
jgi:hypothetical protein